MCSLGAPLILVKMCLCVHALHSSAFCIISSPKKCIRQTVNRWHCIPFTPLHWYRWIGCLACWHVLESISLPKLKFLQFSMRHFIKYNIKHTNFRKRMKQKEKTRRQSVFLETSKNKVQNYDRKHRSGSSRSYFLDNDMQ